MTRHRLTVPYTFTLLLVAAVTPCTAADEKKPAAVRKGQDLIEANTKQILFFACPHAPRLDSAQADGYDILDDGYKVTYTFKWKYGLGSYYIKFAFLFDRAGVFKSVTTPDYGGLNLKAPFGPKEVNEKYLAKIRDFMRQHPKIKEDRKLLEEVDDSDAKSLCKLYLRLEQEKQK